MRNKESLKDAVAGSYAVFGVTNYWENLDAEDEKQQGKNLVDVASSPMFTTSTARLKLPSTRSRPACLSPSSCQVTS
jgi:hypothetical protein